MRVLLISCLVVLFGASMLCLAGNETNFVVRLSTMTNAPYGSSSNEQWHGFGVTAEMFTATYSLTNGYDLTGATNSFGLMPTNLIEAMIIHKPGISYSFWANSDAFQDEDRWISLVGTNTGEHILSKMEGTGGDGVHGGRSQYPDPFQSIQRAAYTNGDWVFIAGVNDYANNYQLFAVNGNVQSNNKSFGSTSNIHDTTVSAGIGVYDDASNPKTFFVNGQIDDIFIWDLAINSDVISFIYTNRNIDFTAEAGGDPPSSDYVDPIGLISW